MPMTSRFRRPVASSKMQPKTRPGMYELGGSGSEVPKLLSLRSSQSLSARSKT